MADRGSGLPVPRLRHQAGDGDARLDEHGEYLEWATLAPGSRADQPRLTFGKIASCVFFAPGGAFYIIHSVDRRLRSITPGASYLLWFGWGLSCTGMQVSMLAELSGASPTITFDGLYAAFGTLNALVVITLIWASRAPSGPPLRRLLAPRTE